MRKLILALLLLPTLALAGTGRITWTMPTQDEDGTAIPATGPDSIVSTTVEYSLCGTSDVFGTKLGEININAPATAGNVIVASAGRYCFRAYVSTAAERSDYSNTIAKVLTGKKPRAPVLVNVVVVVL